MASLMVIDADTVERMKRKKDNEIFKSHFQIKTTFLLWSALVLMDNTVICYYL